MRVPLVGLLFGTAIGFVLAWAQLTDPDVIRRMLLLREPDVFFLMGSAVAVAAVGARLLKATRTRALVTGERVGWSVERPRAHHVLGSVLFGAGWSVAGTCPGPVAAMIGQGRLGGLFVATGLVVGVVLRGSLERRRAGPAPRYETPATAGL